MSTKPLDESLRFGNPGARFTLDEMRKLENSSDERTADRIRRERAHCLRRARA